ncbi:MAG: hypothetical protein ISS51_05340 [Dehalococcoidales bacterium]|nr:hypothetical protein [Dehalococcoidales bacterium]
MTTNELLWFSVAIAGFVIFMEGAITGILSKLKIKLSEQLSRAIAGILLFIIAVIYLYNIPSGN